MSKEHQDEIESFFASKNVRYLPGLARVFDSVTVALLLSQLLYWHELGQRADGWIWKTVEELQAETGLTYNQQKTAIALCRSHGFLQTKKAGLPAKRHLLLDVDKLKSVLVSLSENQELAGAFNQDYIASFSRANTENTQDITPQTTTLSTPLEDNEYVENALTSVMETDNLEDDISNVW